MKYFTESGRGYYLLDIEKTLLYSFALVYVITCAVVMTLEPLIPKQCPYYDAIKGNNNQQQVMIDFKNPQYVYDPCRWVREPRLAFLTVEECEFGRRLVWAMIFGSLVGWERRNADRPAGIRTMSLVSLGSCLFSLCSMFAFLPGPMNWDASRVSAAIPSGVGFLGSALIFKHTTNEEKAWHEVHGLTTAASVWISAAIGIACAGGLYFISCLTTCLVLVMLRFGPRTKFGVDGVDDADTEEDNLSELEANDEIDEEAAVRSSVNTWGWDSLPPPQQTELLPQQKADDYAIPITAGGENPETQSILSSSHRASAGQISPQNYRAMGSIPERMSNLSPTSNNQRPSTLSQRMKKQMSSRKLRPSLM